MKSQLSEVIIVPDGVQVSYKERHLSVQGKHEVVRKLFHPRINIAVTDKGVELSAPLATMREKKNFNSIRAHVNNMIRGSQEGHVYRLKICSGHFPMNSSISGNVLTVKNFLGESVPRKVKFVAGVDVKLDGDIITVTGGDIEKVSQQAAEIEKLTRITNRDRRIFQDGIYIIEKDGVEL